MKRGLRKLCDVYCHLEDALETRERLEAYLAKETIPFEVYSHVNRTGADYWRYAVPVGHISRARQGWPQRRTNHA